MKVPFVDLAAQHGPLRDQILDTWATILDATRFIAGPDVAAFEANFAAMHEVEHGVAVGTGTDALFLALLALGVGPGDEVVVPANTFIATAEAVSLTGARPRIVDCDPLTRNIDTTAAVTALDDPAVVGVLAVHLYGHPADMDPLVAAAERVGKWVMEDAAQAHLAGYRGRRIGGLGRAAAFSFYPSKNLGAPGEGGAVLTDDGELADHLRMLRDHGHTAKYTSAVVGTNGRMHELVAATLNIKLPHLQEWTDRRRTVARTYDELLGGHPLIEIPQEADWAEAVYHLYVVLVPDRDRVMAAIEAAGIGVGLHYPIPIHLQQAYAHLGHEPGSFPVAERSATSLLSLPMFAEMTGDQIEYVATTLRDAVEGST